jgi:glucosyl-dolichyl phosphate glucuronosyltransferase
MVLDVILPTFNREALLARALDSLRVARRPRNLHVRVLVVDNASTDGTRGLVHHAAAGFHGSLQYLFVPTPGKPHALNAGIAATDGDLIGLIDDDEEVERGWFEAVWKQFASAGDALDFIGGKCLPLWGAPRPNWLGSGYLGVIGWVDPGPEARPMDGAYPGILMGGNAVIRRAALARAGSYSVALNRTGTNLLGCEDEDMYHRLLATGARGRYVPDLIIRHYVPAERLTRRYFRRWCLWRGVSLGVMDRHRPEPVKYFAGIPRYVIGRAARGVTRLSAHVLGLRREPDDRVRFENELACWDLVGLVWGRHFSRKTDASPQARPLPASAVDRERLA